MPQDQMSALEVHGWPKYTSGLRYVMEVISRSEGSVTLWEMI